MYLPFWQVFSTRYVMREKGERVCVLHQGGGRFQIQMESVYTGAYGLVSLENRADGIPMLYIFFLDLVLYIIRDLQCSLLFWQDFIWSLWFAPWRKFQNESFDKKETSGNPDAVFYGLGCGEHLLNPLFCKNLDWFFSLSSEVFQ